MRKKPAAVAIVLRSCAWLRPSGDTSRRRRQCRWIDADGPAAIGPARAATPRRQHPRLQGILREVLRQSRLPAVPRSPWDDDGPDDAFRNSTEAELHALGASDEILRMPSKGHEGLIKRYTEAKTIKVPIARQACTTRNHRPVRLDAPRRRAAAFQPHGAVDPGGSEIPGRARRTAGLYMAEDPEAPNTTRSQDHPQHAERQPRSDAPQGHSPGLGWRSVRRQGIRRPARRVHVRAVPGPLRGIQRRGGRSF